MSWFRVSNKTTIDMLNKRYKRSFSTMIYPHGEVEIDNEYTLTSESRSYYIQLSRDKENPDWRHLVPDENTYTLILCDCCK